MINTIFFQKSQTATEYLVILAVVIVISLITVSTLTDITGLGGGIDEKTARLTLAAQTIAITEYAISDYDTLLTLKNNHKNTVTIDTISVNGEECLFFYGTAHRLTPGQTKNIVCQNVYELEETDVEYAIQINYTDYSTGASFSQSDSEAVLVANVLDKYMLTLTSNDYWNSSIDGCYDNSSLSYIPVCTCVDLNKMRYDLGGNHTLQNSIDFERCYDEFGVDYITGSGWSPIGSTSSTDYTGVFDGSENIISHLYISRSGTNYLGLFGYGENANAVYKNVGIVSSYVSGRNDVALLVGSAYSSSIINVFASGGVNGSSWGALITASCEAGSLKRSYATGELNVTGGTSGLVAGEAVICDLDQVYSKGIVRGTDANSKLGGLAGQGAPTNSYSLATVNAPDSAGVGGLVGYSSGTISNSYYIGTIYGDSFVGGLVGFSMGNAISSSSAVATIQSLSGGFIGGLVGYQYGDVDNSYSKGIVNSSGATYVGGLLGYGCCNIDNSYTESTVIGGNTGGLVGASWGQPVSITGNSYWINRSDDAYDCVGDWDASGTDCYAVN